MHYHGKDDQLFVVDKLLVLIDEFWVKKEFKGFKLEMEEGLGHSYTEKSFVRMNEFIAEQLASDAKL